MLILLPGIAFAQGTSILPNARTQFIDANGAPVVGGTVGFYIPGTLTLKGTWQDPGKTSPNTNPIILDALGSGLIWGAGSYREILKDATGSVIWDGVTASIPTGAGTVTSITAGTGLTGGTITSSGTFTVDSSIVGFQNLSNTWLDFNEFSAGVSNCNCGFMSWEPTDYGVGKPALSIQKDATANSWTIGLFDGVSDTGTIRFSASSVVIPGSLTITGGSTIGGSAICTTATGCGGGGGGYATVYDVVATYGGDPTGSADNSTAFNSALAACSGAGGGIIWFQGGHYKFTSAISTTVAGCSIKGAGGVATFFLPTGAIGDFLTINFGSSVNPTEFSDFGITPGSGWSSGFAITGAPTFTHFHDLYFLSPPQAIHVTGGAMPSFDNINIWVTSSAPAILCDNALGTVFGVMFDKTNVNAAGTGTVIEQGAGCNSTNFSNTTESGGGGGICYHTTSSSGTFTVLTNFTCDHTDQGVVFDGGSGIQISNSWFGSTISGNGITFSGSFSGFASISNSHIRDNNGDNVLIGGGQVQLVGNIISGAGNWNVEVASNVSNFQVNSNLIGVPGDPTSAIGIAVNSGSSDYYTITNNVCGANNSACVVDNGSGSKKTVTGNVGP